MCSDQELHPAMSLSSDNTVRSCYMIECDTLKLACLVGWLEAYLEHHFSSCTGPCLTVENGLLLFDSQNSVETKGRSVQSRFMCKSSIQEVNSERQRDTSVHVLANATAAEGILICIWLPADFASSTSCNSHDLLQWGGSSGSLESGVFIITKSSSVLSIGIFVIDCR